MADRSGTVPRATSSPHETEATGFRRNKSPLCTSLSHFGPESNGFPGHGSQGVPGSLSTAVFPEVRTRKETGPRTGEGNVARCERAAVQHPGGDLVLQKFLPLRTLTNQGHRQGGFEGKRLLWTKGLLVPPMFVGEGPGHLRARKVLKGREQRTARSFARSPDVDLRPTIEVETTCGSIANSEACGGPLRACESGWCGADRVNCVANHRKLDRPFSVMRDQIVTPDGV